MERMLKELKKIVLLRRLLFWSRNYDLTCPIAFCLARNELKGCLWTVVFTHILPAPEEPPLACSTGFFHLLVESLPLSPGWAWNPGCRVQSLCGLRGYFCGMDSVLYFPPVFNLLPFLEDWAKHSLNIWFGGLLIWPFYFVLSFGILVSVRFTFL